MAEFDHWQVLRVSQQAGTAREWLLPLVGYQQLHLSKHFWACKAKPSLHGSVEIAWHRLAGGQERQSQQEGLGKALCCQNPTP